MQILMYGGPVFGQQMIVEHINEHSGITSPFQRDSRAAPPKGRLRFRKVINGPMQRYYLCQINRQYSTVKVPLIQSPMTPPTSKAGSSPARNAWAKKFNVVASVMDDQPLEVFTTCNLLKKFAWRIKLLRVGKNKASSSIFIT